MFGYNTYTVEGTKYYPSSLIFIFLQTSLSILREYRYFQSC
jgi:hypothetical protein